MRPSPSSAAARSVRLPMDRPQLASDCATYEQETIEGWLMTKGESPFTRAPMTSSALRPNRLAANFIEMVRNTWRNGQECQAAVKEPFPAMVGSDLIFAILEGRSREAVELLARPVEDRVLNSVVGPKGEMGSLLHWALRLEMPDVAHALLKRADFRSAWMWSEGVLPIHIAAFLGYAQLCNQLAKGISVSGIQTPSRLSLQFGGRELPASSTALSVARLRGHSSVVKLLEARIRAGELPSSVLKAPFRIGRSMDPV